ncbi:MAG: GxxExxY protein [Planctomycetota bacterium]
MDVPEDVIMKDVWTVGLEIHKELGPGLLESVYQQILAAELKALGHKVECEVDCKLNWKRREFRKAFRADVIIDGIVILEIKATDSMPPVFARQLRTYLKVIGLRLGAVVNFGLATFKQGFSRQAMGMPK